ncbi:MAG: 5-formyltetrahydrofolate cyclo-ligase [Alphaproteobacteria bacterium]|nr:MAG: 5-formyltetrahydrofolate cyclo-ligase [Alphaproteobacteria bacterium]
MSARQQKAALRESALARRDRLHPGRRAEASRLVADHAEPEIAFEPGTVVAGFLPIRSEIDLRPLMQRLAARGARLCLPAVVDRMTIAFREYVPGEVLVATGFGTVGPGPEAAVLDPAILLMPLAAFDAAGNRIGYGAGHYDRAIDRLLAKGIEPMRIGFAFSVQEVDHVPAQPHDRRLDAVVTEAGFRWLRRDSGKRAKAG